MMTIEENVQEEENTANKWENYWGLFGAGDIARLLVTAFCIRIKQVVIK